MLRFAALPLIAFCGFAKSQDLSNPITFSFPAAPATVVLEEIQKKSGVRLTVSAALEREPILVRVKEVPLSELMKRIAAVTHAEWRQEGGGYRLERPSRIQRELEQKSVMERAERIRKAVQKAVEQLSGSFSKADAEALIQMHTTDQPFRGNMSEMGARSPGTRAIVKLISLLDAETLAAIPEGGRVVFSDAPNRAQRALPNRSRQVIQSFVDEQKMYSDLAKERDPQWGNMVRVFSGVGSPYIGPGDPSNGIGRTLLSVTRGAETLNFRFMVADRQGFGISNGFYSVSVPVVEATTVEENTGAPLLISSLSAEIAQALGSKELQVPFSGRSMQMVSMANGKEVRYSSYEDAPRSPAISEELRKVLMNPQKADPVAGLPSELILAAAGDRNVVARLTDRSLRTFARAVSEKRHTGQAVLGAISTQAGLVTDLSEGWVTVAPSDPLFTEARRVDRKALAQVLDVASRNGYLRLNDIAQYLLSFTGVPSIEEVDGLYLRLISPAAAKQVFSSSATSNYTAVRFYGALSEPQRNGLLNGSAIPIANLPAKAKALLNWDAFTSWDGPRIQLDQPFPKGPMVNPDLAAIGLERTEAFPDGLPANGVVKLSANKETAAYGVDRSLGRAAFFTAQQLASFQLQTLREELRAQIPSQPYNEFMLAETLNLELQVELGRNATMNRSLADQWVNPNQKPLPYASLPESFRQSVEEQLAAMQQAFLPMRGNRSVKPPAP